jgi:DNA primase
VNGPQGSDNKSLVLAATDIVELIGQTVSLKRRGKDFVGLCPFHQEKTPSFTVSPAKQFFHCYGCKTGGNAIDFVIKRDRIEFIDALKLLAERAGIELPRYGASKEKTSERQLLLEAHSAACALFEKFLGDPVTGKAAREYLQSRGFSAESIKQFQIGFVPEAWDALLRSPAMKRFPVGLLQQAGLAKAREGGTGHYDTFRNRLIFPIRDETGRVIAFGGRVMPGSEDPAKYLNSPETPLFSKSRSIFGLDLARQKIVETRMVAVVEGYTDVVMAHQFGATNVVSILGTAMTPQHVNILRRFADRIVLLFDADTAGDVAVNRAVELFLTQPVEIAIASMPEGVDPDEYLLQHGVEVFNKLLSEAGDALTYKWRQLDRQFNASSDLTGQQKAVAQYLELLAGARQAGPIDSLRWGAVLSRVARLTQIPIEDLHRRFKTPRISDRRPAAALEARATAQDLAERWILGILLNQPALWHDVQQTVRPEEFTDAQRRQLAEVYWAHQRDEGEPVFREFLGNLPSEELKTLAIGLIEEDESLEDSEARLSSALQHIALTSQRNEQSKLFAAAQRTSDSPESAQDALDVLKKSQEHARRPDLRRVVS